MSLKSKPIYIIRPDETYYCGPGFVPYYYKEELKEKGFQMPCGGKKKAKK